MRRHLWCQLVGATTALVLMATPTLAAQKIKQPIKIGLLYALSGLASVYTRGTIAGHEIAAEEINRKGGLLGGRKLEFVTRDNKLKPSVAVNEFRRLVTQDNVALVMGVISSKVALAVSQMAREMDTLFVSTIAQSSALTEERGHLYIARMNTNSTVMGRTAALAAAEQEWKSYYFIGPDYEWGHVVNSDFWEYLQQQKTSVEKMGDLWPRLGERDFSSYIATLMQAKPDAVFSSLWGGDLIAFIKQASDYGLFDKIHFISTGAGDLDILKPLGPDMPDGVMATFLYAFDMPMPGKEAENKSFVGKFKEKTGHEPRSGDIIGYISTYMIADAINKAGTTRSKKLAKTLRGMSFDTILGQVVIRSFDGQATFGYYTGFTYTHPDYPFKRLKNAIHADGSNILHSEDEVKKIRADYEKNRR